MAVTTATTSDVSQALAMALADVAGLRVVWYVADTSRPPVCIVGQPRIDYTDNLGGFCRATWDYPLTIITIRNSERDAQAELSRLVSEVAQALDVAQVDGIAEISPQRADPVPGGVSVNGQDLPAYELRVLVRA